METVSTYTLTAADREELITSNLQLVKHCVSTMHVKNSPSGLDFDDLVGHGILGLIQAANRFDNTKGAKFSTFAVTRIRGAVLDAMRTLDPVGRPTRHVSKQIAEEFNKLSLELGREPTASEVQSGAGIGEQQYWSARRASSISLISTDTPLEDGSSLADRLGDTGPGVSAGIERRELSHELARAISQLPERDRLVLSLYYVDGLTMGEVAHSMGLSETRVSQLLRRTYARLRADRGLAAAA